MGRPKQLLMLEGRAFASRIADAVGPLVESVALLGAGEVPAELSGFERIADAPGVAGPMSGIIAALKSSPRSAWLIAACDMPFLTTAASRWLISQRAIDRCAIFPETQEGRAEPLAAIYEPAAIPFLLEMASRGEFALQPLACAIGTIVRVPPEHRQAWRNINHPTELV